MLFVQREWDDLSGFRNCITIPLLFSTSTECLGYLLPSPPLLLYYLHSTMPGHAILFLLSGHLQSTSTLRYRIVSITPLRHGGVGTLARGWPYHTPYNTVFALTAKIGQAQLT